MESFFKKSNNFQKAKLHQTSLNGLFEISKTDNWNKIEDSVIKFMNSEALFLKDILRRGDVVEITDVNNYRNDGRVIWNGKKFIALDYDIDEYGAVPKEFLILTEFPPMYWEFAIDHNYIQHVKASDLTFVGEKVFPEDPDEEIKYIYTFSYKGTNWTIVSDSKIKTSSTISIEITEDHDGVEFIRVGN
jgi:hypothetical protein